MSNDPGGKRVALLCAAESPLGGYYVESFQRVGFMPACIVVDRKGWSEKDVAIHAERTGGRLPALTIESMRDRLHGACEVVFVENHNSPEGIRALIDRGCEIVANGGTPRILKQAFLASFEAVINCHPGMLPKYRGCTCVEWAVFNDDPVGNTAHLMTEGIDEGAIIRSEALPLSAGDDYASTRVKIYLHACDLLARVTREVALRQIDVTALPPQPAGTYWKPIEPEKLEQVVSKLKAGRYRYQS